MALRDIFFDSPENIISSENVVRVPGAVDVGRFKPLNKKKELRRKFNFPEDELIILYVGRLTEVKQPFINLDQWIRRRLRKLLWRQWKKPKTSYKKMVQLGVKADRAKKAVAGGRGPWYNAGASHMHAAVPNRLLEKWGLLCLVQKHRQSDLHTSR